MLKEFLNCATESGINKHMHYKNIKFTATWEKADSIYLTEAELQLLVELDLSQNKTLEIVRDLFLIGCYTGLRYSDFSTIGSHKLSNDKLVGKTFKTGEIVVIPLHLDVKSIFLSMWVNCRTALVTKKPTII